MKEGLSLFSVDTDARPDVHRSRSLDGEGAEHRGMGTLTIEKRTDGKLYANGVEVVRYLSPRQVEPFTIIGHELRKELRDKQPMNACVLWALSSHPHLVPESWKRGRTFFWGTIYRNLDDVRQNEGHPLYGIDPLEVEYLYWFGTRWNFGFLKLSHAWHGMDPAAVLASQK